MKTFCLVAFINTTSVANYTLYALIDKTLCGTRSNPYGQLKQAIERGTIAELLTTVHNNAEEAFLIVGAADRKRSRAREMKSVVVYPLSFA